MRFMKWLAAVAFAAALPCVALAQTSPNLSKGQVLTAGQWNQLFQSKQDTLGFTPLNVAGGVMTGRLVTAAPGAATSSLNLTPGSTPASPANGDLWLTSLGLFAQVNGVTIGPLSGGSSASFGNTSPVTLSFPSGVVTYACPTCGVTTNPLSQFAVTTSAQLAGIVSDETGSGPLVFRTSPALITPVLGVATATSINGITITTGTGTLALGSNTFTLGSAMTVSGPTTIASGGFTQAGAFATTLTSTATTNSTLPAGTHTLAGLDVNQTFSGTNNFSGTFQIGGTAQTFPASGLIAGTTDTQSLTHTSLTATTDVLGGVTMTLGSDATGDIYYRNAGGFLTRLAIGGGANVLTVSGGLPAWAAPTGGGNVSNTGTPTNLQIAQWTNATTIAGVNFSSLHTAGAGITLTGTNNVTIAQSLTNATVQASPTVGGGTGITPAMQGFGSVCKLTPVYSSRVKVSFIATIANNTGTTNTSAYNFRYGTGVAPAFGAAAAGTAILNTMTVTHPVASANQQIGLDGIVTGLTPGTAYWFDMIVNSSANTSTLATPNCDIFEF